MTSSSNYSKKAILRPRVTRQILSRVQRAWLSYVGVVTLYALIFSFWQAEPVPAGAHCWGILIAALCLFPLGLWSARGGKGLPMFELICIAYLLAFGMPLYLQLNQTVIFSAPRVFSWEETERTLSWVALGISALLGSYYSFKWNRVINSVSRVDLPMLPLQRRKYLQCVLIPALLFSMIQSALGGAGDSSLGAVLRLFTFQFQIAIVLLAYEVYQGRLTAPVWRFALFGCVGFSALLGMSTGLLENAILPILLLVIVRWHVKGRLPTAWLAAGFCLFLVLNVAKMSYRRQIWFGNADSSVAGRANIWAQAAQGVVTDLNNGNGPTVFETFRNSMQRFDLLHQFIWVQQMTPQSVPFYEGFSYRYLVYGWIPRFLWPDKPSVMEDTLKTSVDYRFLSPTDNVTSLGIGHLPEAYANFGVMGIAIIMALQGLVFCLVDHIFNGPRSDAGRAVYLTIMIFFLNGIGSATAGLFLLIGPNAIANSVILFMFCRRWRAPRVASVAVHKPFSGIAH